MSKSIHSWFLSLVALSMLAVGAVAGAENRPGPPPETSQYAFKIGEWHLKAKAMQPDRTFLEGVGTSQVSYIHGGRTIQDDIDVTFEDGSGFAGTTLRTFDPQSGDWMVAYFPANGQTVSTIRGRAEEGGMLEVGSGEDQHGKFTASLHLFDISSTRFSVRLDRLYADGNVEIKGVWQYEATRVK